MILEFVIPGDPKAEARHRTAYYAGRVHTYEPVDCKNQKAFVKYLALHEMQKIQWVKTDQPISMEIIAHIAVAKSVTKKVRALALKGVILPTKKPDVDNLAKLVQDALNDLAYDDDKQIVKLSVSKIYDKDAYTEVKIEVITNGQ